MGGEGIGRSLAELMDDGLLTAALGTVESIETHADFGYLLNVILVDERPVQARLLAAGGHGINGGMWVPVLEGEEVLVIFPESDINNGLAIAGLSSKPRPIPADFDNVQPIFTHTKGLQFRLADGNTVEALLVKSLADGLKTYIDALDTYFSATIPPGGTVVNNASALSAIAVAKVAFVASTASSLFASKLGGTDYHSKSIKSDKG